MIRVDQIAGGKHLLVDVEEDPHALVSDRVDVGRQPGGDRLLDQTLQVSGRELGVALVPPQGERQTLDPLRQHDLADQPEVARVVVVLLEEHGSTAPHDPVDPRLVADELEPVVAESLRDPQPTRVRDVVQRGADPDSRGQLAAPLQLLVGAQLGGGGDVLDRGDAALPRLAQHLAHLGEPLLERLGCDRGPH